MNNSRSLISGLVKSGVNDECPKRTRCSVADPIAFDAAQQCLHGHRGFHPGFGWIQVGRRALRTGKRNEPRMRRCNQLWWRHSCRSLHPICDLPREPGHPGLDLRLPWNRRIPPQRLRGFVATAEDWSELDCSGAIAWLRARYPNAELVGLAHSVGAMLFGAASNVSELSRLVFIGAHTGYFGDYRICIGFRWPYSGMGSCRCSRMCLAIFRDVCCGWAKHSRRCGSAVGITTFSGTPPGIKRPEDEANRMLLSRYAAVRVPIYALSFSDDAFATVRGAQRLLAMYSGVTARHDVIDPATVGLGKIGHFGFFRRSNGPTLWPMLLPFLLSSSPSNPSSGRVAEPPT